MYLEYIALGLLASLIVGAATGIGGIPVLFMKNVSQRTLDSMLGFASGVMLAATAFSLIIPALEMGGIGITTVFFLLGALFIYLLDRYVPHQHLFKGREGPPSQLSGISLVMLAIILHNFPEGMAVGVTFGGGDIAAGFIIGTAIALQNIPEGSAIAFPLVREGFRRRRAACYALLSGMVEPIGGLIGATLVALAYQILPVGLAFSGGAMAFVVSHEMIPESHRSGHEKEATFGFIIGFTVMMVLDNILS